MGARFRGRYSDLDLHCARVNDSAKKLYLKPVVSTEEWVRLAREGIKLFKDTETALYIRPMYWAEKKDRGFSAHQPDSTEWCLCIYGSTDAPSEGLLAHLSSLSQAEP